IVKTLKNIADYASKVAEIYRLKMHPDLNLNYDEYLWSPAPAATNFPNFTDFFQKNRNFLPKNTSI
ncbi:MAG: hypothetical protein II330_04780, partial [Clostridia bacterium]|nr:hypothetical protein [Clostridia bacterium]